MIDIYDDPKQLNLYPKDNSGLYHTYHLYVALKGPISLVILTPKEIKIKKRVKKSRSLRGSGHFSNVTTSTTY